MLSAYNLCKILGYNYNNIWNLKVELEEDFFEDVLTTALFDGIGYWFNYLEKEVVMTDKYEYIEDAILEEEGFIEITYEGEKYMLNLNSLINGYKMYCQRAIERERVVHTDAGLIDSELADVIIQLGVFGKIIFG